MTVGVASTVYRAHVAPHAPPLCVQTVHMQDGKCFGLACYRATFLATTGLCLVGALLATALAARMRPFYRRTRGVASADGAATIAPAALE